MDVPSLTETVIIAVTVITWVLRDLTTIVVDKLVAGEKGLIVCLKLVLVKSVATHGHGILLLLIVTNFHQESWLAKIGWKLVGMIILYNICNWVPRCTHTCGTVVPKG